MAIVVCKKVRLAINGDKFDKKLIAEVERTNAKIDDELVEQFNANWKTSGRLYIVDKEATEKRNKILEKGTDKPDGLDREALKAEAAGLGIEFPKNIKTDALAQKIADKKAE